MKTKTLFVLFSLIILTFSSIRSHADSNPLSEGSALMTALGGQSELSQFTNLLKTPGLDKILGNVLKKPFTMLAPNNEALASMGANAVASLAKPENLNKLANLVKNQIIPGKVDAAALMKGGLKSAGGKAVELGTAQLGKMIGGDAFNLFSIDKLLK